MDHWKKRKEEVIKHLTNYFNWYWRPERLISDRGTCFTSKLFRDFLKENNVIHVLNATATPRANGQVERFNRTIRPMLAKLINENVQWDQVISRCEFVLNNVENSSKKYSPSVGLFGAEQRGEVIDAIREIHPRNTEKNINTIREEMRNNIAKSQRINERATIMGNVAQYENIRKQIWLVCVVRIKNKVLIIN